MASFAVKVNLERTLDERNHGNPPVAQYKISQHWPVAQYFFCNNLVFLNDSRKFIKKIYQICTYK